MKNMNFLLEKELSGGSKITKPDFSTMSGREMFAAYLYSKFKQILEYDKNSKTPVFQKINPDFIPRFTKRLIHNPQKHILIGISGESASGKTTICNTIKNETEKLCMPVEIMSADNYFRDISELIKEYGSFDKLLASGYDVDSPDNFNMEQLYTDLDRLSRGIDVKIPEYLVNGTGVVVPEAIPKKAKKIIVVEGMATMHGKSADLFDIKIYVDIDPEIQEKWFIYRAQTSRNQNEENARKQLAYVREASKKYILPKKDNSDIIINGAASLDYFTEIINYIYDITNNYSMPAIGNVKNWKDIKKREALFQGLFYIIWKEELITFYFFLKHPEKIFFAFYVLFYNS